MKKFFLLVAILFLTACSSNKIPKSYTIHSEDISLNPEQKVILVLERSVNDRNDISEQFRVVKPSHTAKLTGLKVLGFLAGQHTTGFSKDELVGDVVELENMYIYYTFPKLKELIQKNIKLDKGTKNKYITIYPSNFKLLYDELVGNDKYTLHYGFKVLTTFQHKNDMGEIVAGNNSYDCYEKLGGKDFIEWENNNYELVISTAKQMSDKCLNNMADFLNKIK